MFKNLRSTLLVGFLGFTSISIIVGLISIVFIQKSNSVKDIVDKIKDIHHYTLSDFKLIHTFLNYEAVNKQFYISGKSKYIDEHIILEDSIRYSLFKLLGADIIKQNNFDSIIYAIIGEYQEYSLLFITISELQMERGFENHGIIGEMRDYAHYLEDTKLVPDYDLLMLRRHEKDFLLRNMLKYQTLFHSRANILNVTLIESNISHKVKDSLIIALKKYESLFDQVVFISKKLGTKDNTALAKQLQESSVKIDGLLSQLLHQSKQHESLMSKKYTFLLLFLYLVIIFISVLLAFLISRKMTWKLSALSRGMRQFIESNFENIEDDLPEKMTSDEVGSILYHYKFLQLEIRDLIFDFKKKVSERTEEIETQKERIERQSIEITSQRDELYMQNKYIEEQNELLETKNSEMMDGIKYAAGIQRSLMPSESQVDAIFPNHFIVNLPLGIVSGDFYWVNTVCIKNRLYKIIAVADCTGHGVPGALVSMLGISLLNEIVLRRKVVVPSIILSLLRQNILDAMIRFGNTEKLSDGMDIAIAVIDVEQEKLQFSGANRDLYIVRNGQLEVRKGDKMPIGKYLKHEQEFNDSLMHLYENDSIYMLTDGYTDQFGGKQNKKFTKRQFRNLLIELSELSMAEQAQHITSTMYNWKGENEQIDDILVLGVSV